MLKIFRNTCLLLILFFVQAFASPVPETKHQDTWPQEIMTPKGVLIIYQPQPEKLEGNILYARAAVAIEMQDSGEPVFGVVWFKAILGTDRDERMAVINGFQIERMNFPNQDIEKEKLLSDTLEKQIPNLSLEIAMDNLLATLETSEKQLVNTEKLSIDPPVILFEKEPAVLISLDGEPRMKPEENSSLMRVINTPFTIIFEQKEGAYYLFAGEDTWYRAVDIKGSWEIAPVPKDVAGLAPEPEEGEEKSDGADKGTPGPAPKIIVATEPTELISCTGDPEFTPISGTQLLYISNTDSDVLMDIPSQTYYVLLAGRWFLAKSTDGPWTYVPGDKLPKDFSKIPEESEMGTVLYAVPETKVAKEAVADAAIPQTAVIDRKTASLIVKYDGDPKFEKISNTKMTYGVNTATPVIHVEKKYYACDNGVWFVSSKAEGPWEVAVFIPQEIYTITPECPIYNVTFVRIYKVTEDEVIMGYTAGYTHTYIYQTTVVYGTGYYYPGYCGYYCYPCHSTWGYYVRYNPWSGWRFGFSYSTGPFRFTIGYGGWYRGGWWGPGRYRGYRHGYRHGYRKGRAAGYRAGYRQDKQKSSRQNLYRSQANKARVKPSSLSKAGMAMEKRSNRPNNVYADNKGYIHRKTQDGWEKMTQDGWKKDTGSRPDRQLNQPSSNQSRRQSSKPAVDRVPSRQQLENSHKSRQRGNQQARKFNQTRGGGRGSGPRR